MLLPFLLTKITHSVAVMFWVGCLAANCENVGSLALLQCTEFRAKVQEFRGVSGAGAKRFHLRARLSGGRLRLSCPPE